MVGATTRSCDTQKNPIVLMHFPLTPQPFSVVYYVEQWFIFVSFSPVPQLSHACKGFEANARFSAYIHPRVPMSYTQQTFSRKERSDIAFIRCVSQQRLVPVNIF